MKLGEQLEADGVLTAEQLEAGLERAACTGERLGAALIGLGYVSGDDIAVALSRQHRVPAARDRHLEAPPPELIALVPAELAHRDHAIAVGEGRDRELIVALADPDDPRAIARLEEATKRVVVPAAASIARLEAAVARLYPLAVAHDDIASAALAAGEVMVAPAPAPAAAAAPIPPPPSGLSTEPRAPARPTRPPPTGPQRPSVPRTVTGPVVSRTKTPHRIGGGTTASSGEPSAALGSIVRVVLGIAIVGGVGALAYHQCAPEDETSAVTDGVYHSSRLGARFDLPGTGWRAHQRLAATRQQGKTSVRVEGFYRGALVDDPDEAVLIMRVHAPGQFPQEVDMQAFQKDVERVGQNVTSSAPQLAMGDGIDCRLEPRVRSEPAGRCRGTGTFRDHPVDTYVFYWQDTVDDVVAVVYVARGNIGDRIEAIEGFIREIEIE